MVNVLPQWASFVGLTYSVLALFYDAQEGESTDAIRTAETWADAGLVASMLALILLALRVLRRTPVSLNKPAIAKAERVEGFQTEHHALAAEVAKALAANRSRRGSLSDWEGAEAADAYVNTRETSVVPGAQVNAIGGEVVSQLGVVSDSARSAGGAADVGRT